MGRFIVRDIQNSFLLWEYMMAAPIQSLTLTCNTHTILVEGCESRHGMVAGGMVYVMLQYSAPLVTAARHASGPLAAL